MEGLAAKPHGPFCHRDISVWHEIRWSSRTLSTFAQSNLLVTHSNMSNIKSALQNNFVKLQRFGHRSLAHPFWPEVNPEVLIKATILSKYRKQQAMKHEIISFLVSYTDLQTWDEAHVYCVIACHRPQLGSVANTQVVLGLLRDTAMEDWHGAMVQSWDCLW